MIKFDKPELEVVRFVSDIITSSIDDCPCDIPGVGPWGDNDICTGGTGEGGDIQCIITDEQGNC